jgi:hypothetical protein
MACHGEYKKADQVGQKPDRPEGRLSIYWMPKGQGQYSMVETTSKCSVG